VECNSTVLHFGNCACPKKKKVTVLNNQGLTIKIFILADCWICG